MNLSNGNDKKSKTSGVASLFGRGSASKIGKSQFSRSMGGIMERLKGLSRRDLALVGVGLSVLVAAPVAEYMMSKPADSANMLTSGFSSRDSQSGSASLYEPGINALSQGSADGAGEVITPLSARDPSSLILGAQSDQPPMIDYTPMGGGEGAGGDSSSSSSSSSPDMDDMRDSVRDAARNGASEAVKSAGAPTVIPRMAAGFRGLGSIASAGGTSSSGDSKRKLSAPIKSNVSAKQSTMVNPVASAGYKGVASTPKSGNKSGIEKLRAQGDAQGGYFSGANAIKSLDNANGVKISDIPGDGPGSGFGGGSMGGGEGYKGPSNGGPHDSHKHSGKCETLACKAAEARQKKAIEWELYWQYLPQEIAKECIKAGVSALTGFIGDAAKKGTALLFNEDVDGITKYYCLAPIDTNKKNKAGTTSCVRGNIEIIASSKKQKTIDSWKDNCICGKYTRKEYKDMYGEVAAGGESSEPEIDPKDELVKQEDGEFEKYVTMYDDGVKKFMSELAKVKKNSQSQKGLEASLTAQNTYVSEREGDGIHFPFDKIYWHINKAASIDKERNDKLVNTFNEISSSYRDVANEGKLFLEKLQAMKAEPEKFIKRDKDSNIAVAITIDEKKLIENAIAEYQAKYDLYITAKETERIAAYGYAFKIIDKYIEESRKTNTQVHDNEYINQYIPLVNGLREGLNDTEKDLKTKIGVFLKKIDGTVPVPVDVAAIMVKAERILCAPNDEPLPQDAPSAKARVWRGLAHNFGIDEKDTNEKSLNEKYATAAKQVRRDEVNSWETDSPFTIDDSFPKSVEKLIELDEKAQGDKSAMSKTQFYAPGYRLVVEIPFVLRDQEKRAEILNGRISELKSIYSKHFSLLSEKFNMNGGEGSNGGNQGGGDNGGNGGNQGGGDNGGNGGNQGGGNNGGNGGNQGGTTRSVCANGENNCTYQDIIDAQKWANDRSKYSKKNKVASPVWEEYKNLAPGMDKNDTEWLNHTGKVHTLRREYDELQSEEDSLKPNTPENKTRLEEIDKRKREIEDEVTKERKEADDRWATLCKNAGYSTNACKTSKPQNYSSVNHNNTNTTVPKPTNTTPSSTKPTTDNGQSTGKVPDVLQDIILVNKPQVVPVYDAENNKITVKVCDGLLSEGFPDVCLSYADIRSGANTCFMYTEKDACNRVRNGQLKGWPQKQVDKYGKLIAKKDRKLDGTWHKVQVTATVFDYSLRHSDARNTHMDAPQPLPRLNGTADKEFGANFSSEKKMEEFIFRTNAYCAYSKNSNSWHFKKVTLTAEEGTSSNSIGGSLNVSADVLAVKVSATATYNHSKTTYNFGKEMNYSQNFAGKICK